MRLPWLAVAMLLAGTTPARAGILVQFSGKGVDCAATAVSSRSTESSHQTAREIVQETDLPEELLRYLLVDTNTREPKLRGPARVSEAYAASVKVLIGLALGTPHCEDAQTAFEHGRSRAKLNLKTRQGFHESDAWCELPLPGEWLGPLQLAAVPLVEADLAARMADLQVTLRQAAREIANRRHLPHGKQEVTGVILDARFRDFSPSAWPVVVGLRDDRPAVLYSPGTLTPEALAQRPFIRYAFREETARQDLARLGENPIVLPVRRGAGDGNRLVVVGTRVSERLDALTNVLREGRVTILVAPSNVSPDEGLSIRQIPQESP